MTPERLAGLRREAVRPGVDPDDRAEMARIESDLPVPDEVRAAALSGRPESDDGGAFWREVDAWVVATPARDVAVYLTTQLGSQLSAYLAGTDEATVAAWAAGEQSPDDRTLLRLRYAYKAALMVVSGYGVVTARSWFGGRAVDDEAPAYVLRHQGEDRWRDVVASAIGFISTAFGSAEELRAALLSGRRHSEAVVMAHVAEAIVARSGGAVDAPLPVLPELTGDDAVDVQLQLGLSDGEAGEVLAAVAASDLLRLAALLGRGLGPAGKRVWLGRFWDQLLEGRTDEALAEAEHSRGG
jgi:hypothetical protein